MASIIIFSWLKQTFFYGNIKEITIQIYHRIYLNIDYMFNSLQLIKISYELFNDLI